MPVPQTAGEGALLRRPTLRRPHVLPLFSLFLLGLVLAAGCVFGTGNRGGGGAVDRNNALTMLGADPPTLDPALASDITSTSYLVELFSTLVSFTPELELQPDLAERWEVTDGGKTYVFSLRDNAKFHDGKPVRAADVKYSLERAANPATLSAVADTYLGDIVGIKDVLDKKATSASGIQVRDERTIALTIDQPKAYFLAKLTAPPAMIVDKANVESGNKPWFNKPNGSGPFKLREWRKGDRLVLGRHEGSHLEPAKVDHVNFLLGGGSAMTMYENNELDVTGIGSADLERVTDPNNALNKQLVVAPFFAVDYIALNVGQPPFDDVKLRQALNHAVDKKRIAEVVLKKQVEPASAILPPGFPGYSAEIQGLGFDPEKAKTLLRESRYPDPNNMPRIKLAVAGTGGTAAKYVQAVLEMWRQNLGIQAQIDQVEPATYLEDLKKGKYQAFEVGWAADFLDPQNFLDVLFHSQSATNYGKYANAQVDQLLEQARVGDSLNARLPIYQQAEALIVQDAAWVPLFHLRSYLLVKPWVEGFKPTPIVLPVLRLVTVRAH